jgi:hypothetical protein
MHDLKEATRRIASQYLPAAPWPARQSPREAGQEGACRGASFVDMTAARLTCIKRACRSHENMTALTRVAAPAIPPDSAIRGCNVAAAGLSPPSHVSELP